MFSGSIPGQLRPILADHVRTWDPADVYVACSGNFTIERTVASVAPTARIHGCDVSIYSANIGRWLSGQSVRVRVREESHDRLGWLEPYLDDGVGSVAVLQLLTNFGDAVDRSWQPYFARQLAGYREQFPHLHARTVAKLNEVPVRLASFADRDVREWLPTVPDDAPLVSFPPFFTGGYSKMFAALDRHLTWPAPQFDELTDDDVDDLVDQMTDRPQWLVALPKRHPVLERDRRGVVQTSVRNKPVFVYSSAGHSRIALPTQRTEPVKNTRLSPGARLGDRLALAPLNAGQFAALRSQYLSRKIAPGGARASFGVLVDGVLIGAFAYNPPTLDPEAVYLLSDFPVSPTDYKNLAKLVLVAVLSTEAKQLIERGMSRRIEAFVTTAFTDRPVSMKYRGLAELTSRRDADDPAHRYQLQYRSRLGQWSLEDGFAMWRKRWGQLR